MASKCVRLSSTVMLALFMVALLVVSRDGHRSCSDRLLFPTPSSRAPPARVYVPLKDAAPDWLLVGTAYNDVRLWSAGDPAEEEAYERVVAETFGLVTPENACKPAVIMPSRDGPPDWSGCDRVLAFAQKHRLKFRLHVLAWGEWNPAWMQALGEGEREEALLGYVRAVLGRYAGRVDFVDVVNEAVCDDVLLTPAKQNCGSGPGHTKAGEWVPSVPGYIDKVFRLARKLCAGCTLVYNDYGFESDADVIDSNKHERVHATVAAALARGVPIDAVGFQFHVSELHNGNGLLGLPFSAWLRGVARNFGRFAQLGVQIHVTEIDVGCNMPTLSCFAWESEAAREEGQAQVYAGVLSACLESRACSVFQTWGHSDKYSWRGGGESVDAAMDQRAHLFDRDGQPKCAYFALLDAFDRSEERAGGALR